MTAVSLQSATALVTGTLGLAFPTTAKAMHRAVDAATSSPCCVLVDVNWRPVFWAGQEDIAKVRLHGDPLPGMLSLRQTAGAAPWLTRSGDLSPGQVRHCKLGSCQGLPP